MPIMVSESAQRAREAVQARQQALAVPLKDRIADKLREAGHDFVTAYEEATRVLSEFRQSPCRSLTYYIRSTGRAAFTLTK